MAKDSIKKLTFHFYLIKFCLFVICFILFLLLMTDVFAKFFSKRTTTGVTFTRYYLLFVKPRVSFLKVLVWKQCLVYKSTHVLT